MAYRHQYSRIETIATNFGKLYLELEQESAPADDPRRIEYGKAFDEFEKRSSDILTPEDYQEIFGQSPPDPHPPKSDLDVTSGDFVVGAPTLQSFEPREPRIQLDENADLTGCQIVAIGIEEDDDQVDDLTHPRDTARILGRFPIYVQTLLARRIAIAQHDAPETHRDLDQYTDNELAVLALSTVPLDFDLGRQRAYLRILAVALENFQDDRLAVRRSVDLVRMIASGTPDDDD